MKTRKKYFIIILIIAVIISFIIIVRNNKLIDNIYIQNKQKEEEKELLSYIIYDNQDENNIKTLITINSEDGIEYIQYPDGNIIESNGKNTISIDYLCQKDVEYFFKIKEINKDEKVEKVCANDESIAKTAVSIESIINEQGYKVINISNNIELNGFKTYYKIGDNGEWIEGEGKVLFLDYDVTLDKLVNEDATINCYAKVVNQTNECQITIKQNYDVDINSTVSAWTADSLIDGIEKYDFGTGEYQVTVADETYSLKIYSFEGSQRWTTDMTFGTEKDVATSNSYAQNMIVVKVNGDLTIDEGVNVTAYASSKGYGGPKGMFIYCSGTLTNNGTISMTARGAKAEGQNVYLWKNEDNTYEYVPAVGEEGGSRKSSTYNQTSALTGGTTILPKNGSYTLPRTTGGGASGSRI